MTVTCNISSLILSTDGFGDSCDDCGLPCKSSQNGGFILQTCIERDATNLTMPSLQPSDELWPTEGLKKKKKAESGLK